MVLRTNLGGKGTAAEMRLSQNAPGNVTHKIHKNYRR